jgi:uncharacterized protein YwqG/predicted DNA-binding protein (MmcQ/YjbR family)
MIHNRLLISEFLSYALSKRGAEQKLGWEDRPIVRVRGRGWMDFFAVEITDDKNALRLPASDEMFNRFRSIQPSIARSPWPERDGHIYIEIPLDENIPAEFIKSAIDHGYALVWSKLDRHGLLMLDLADAPFDQALQLNRLIDFHELGQLRRQVHGLVRPAILLRVCERSEAQIALGATRIGGEPDLAITTDWPAYRNMRSPNAAEFGKPLAFLMQINLAKIAALGTPIAGLPTGGLLSVFSVWGWMEESGVDPQVPRDRTEDKQEECGWTVVLHTPPSVNLSRRHTPAGVNIFQTGAVELIPTLTLPNNRREPALASLQLSEDEYARLDSLETDLRTLEAIHCFNTSELMMRRHLLGGYAVFQQYFPDELEQKRLAMLLQIGSDDHALLYWGDGGELTFYADAEALAHGRFERIWGTCQGG